MRLVVTCRGAHHGQIDASILAYQEDKLVGVLDYSQYNAIPSIQNIQVDLDHQRQGIGRAMVRRLQEDHPDQEIEWGMMTPEGAALKESFEWVEIESPYKPDFDRLDALKTSVEAFCFDTASIEDANAANDALCDIDSLEMHLYGKSPTLRLLR